MLFPQPNVSLMPTLKSTNIKNDPEVLLQNGHKINDNNLISDNINITDANKIDPNRQINIEGTRGNINVKADQNNNVISIIPFFTNKTYYKIVNKVGGLKLDVRDINNLKDSSSVIFLNSGGLPLLGTGFNNVSLFSANPLITNVYTNKVGLITSSGIYI